MKKHLSLVGAIRGLARVCMPLMLVFILSCSDDDPAKPDPPPPVQPPPTGDVTQSIPPTGGTIAATSEEGAIISVTVPGGAVGSALQFGLRPRTPEAGTWVNVITEPKYMVFFKGIDVAIKAPNGFAVDSTHQLFLGTKSDPSLLPTVYIDTLRTLNTTINGFGASSDDPVGFVQRVAPAAEVANNISAAPFTCPEHVQIAQQAIDDFIASGTYDAAVKAMFAAASCVSREECADVDEWVGTVTQIACDSLFDALAATGSITSYGQFRQVAAPVVYWAAIARALDPSCSSLSQITTTLATWISSFFADFFDDELDALTKDDYVTFAALKDEARDAHKLFTEALFLGETAAATQLQDDFLYPALNSMRARAYTLCMSDTWHYPLSRLTSVGFYADHDEVGVTPPNNPLLTEPSRYAQFTDQNIWDDIQLCATQVDVTTSALSGGQLAMESGGGNSSPGSYVTSIDIRTPSRGKLVVGGGIGAITCWNDVPGDNQVIFQIGGTQVHTINRSGEEYLTPPVEFDIRSLALSTGAEFDDGKRVTMLVRRTRNTCDDRLWGSRNYHLLQINMDIEGPAGLTVTHNTPDTVRAGETVPLEVTVEVIDQFGVGSFESGVSVSLSAVAGTAVVPLDPATGQTDTNGVFNSQMIIPPDPASANKALSSAAQNLILTITANADGIDTTEVVEPVFETCVVRGALSANSQEELDAFDEVCRVEGTLQLGDDGSGTRISNLNALSNLTYAEAVVISNTALTSLDGLEKLALNTTASLSILNNASLANVDSLGSRAQGVTRVFVILQIKNNPSLTRIDGVDNLVRTTGATAAFLEVEGNGVLASLTGLQKVTSVGTLLNVTDNDLLTSLSGLVPTTVGILRIDGNALLKSLSTFVSTTVSDSLVIRDNPVLPNLNGLGLVRSLTNGCVISGNGDLVDIDGLQNLMSVGALFAITKNPKLCLPLPTWVDQVSAGSADFSENGTDSSCNPSMN